MGNCKSRPDGGAGAAPSQENGNGNGNGAHKSKAAKHKPGAVLTREKSPVNTGDIVSDQLAGTMGTGEWLKFSGYSPDLPVLIVPGFMSSALEIEHSDAQPSWEGKRAWMDLATLGISALAINPGGKKAKQQQQVQENGSMVSRMGTLRAMSLGASKGKAPSENLAAMAGVDESDEAKKNNWIRHLLVEGEGWRDPEGIRVRPIESNYGLDGVEYLSEGMAQNVSYVFARVSAQLRMAGYEPGFNLRAAPYDWRLPPGRLEERDSYFSRLKATAEEMVEANGGRGLALVAHSMGCRIVLYFLQWLMVNAEALFGGTSGASENMARAWIDDHIHSFVPVGGPFLGAPTTMSSVLSGDYMGLEAFLSHQEALVLGRKLGSVPFLFPHALILRGLGLKSMMYIRRQNVLRITVGGVEGNLTEAARERLAKPPATLHHYFSEVLLKSHGSKVTGFRGSKTPALGTSQTPVFGDHFQLALNDVSAIPTEMEIIVRIGSPRTHKNGYRSLFEAPARINLQELALDQQPGVPRSCQAALAPGTWINMELTWLTPEACTDGEVLRAKLGSVLKACGMEPLARGCGGPGIGCEPPPPRHKSMSSKNLVVGAEKREHMKVWAKTKLQYDAFSIEELMAVDGMDDEYSNWQRNYRDDPAFGVGRRAEATPPLRRVLHIYGTNIDTEIGSVYRHRTCRRKPAQVESSIELDTAARLGAEKNRSSNHGPVIEDGLILETKNTAQVVCDTGETKQISGDGTVPYASMRHCMTWQESGVDVRCEELPGALHRDILADPRMHKAMLLECLKPPVGRLRITLKSCCENDLHPTIKMIKSFPGYFAARGTWFFYLKAVFRATAVRTELKRGPLTNIKWDRNILEFGLSEHDLQVRDSADSSTNGDSAAGGSCDGHDRHPHQKPKHDPPHPNNDGVDNKPHGVLEINLQHIPLAIPVSDLALRTAANMFPTLPIPHALIGTFRVDMAAAYRRLSCQPPGQRTEAATLQMMEGQEGLGAPFSLEVDLEALL